MEDERGRLLRELKEIKKTQTEILKEIHDLRFEMRREFALLKDSIEHGKTSPSMCAMKSELGESPRVIKKKEKKEKKKGEDGGDYYRDLITSIKNQKGGQRKVSKLLASKSSNDFDSDGSRTPRPQLNHKSHEERKISPRREELTKREWIVFVNVNSGGKQGPRVLRMFRGAVPSERVIDLNSSGPDKGLEVWRKDPDKYRILVCGGDGTVNWVLGALDRVMEEDQLSPPVVGLVPLGTGNDMSRTLGWGPSYEKKKLHVLFSMLNRAKPVALDRWKVECFTASFPFEDNKKKKKRKRKNSLSLSFSKDKDKEKDKEKEKEKENEEDKEKEKEQEGSEKEGGESASFVMNNYFSMGVDAEIVLGFHKLRERNTNLFQGVLLNKGWYAGFSAKVAFDLSNEKLHKVLRLIVDNEEIDIPKKVRSVVIMNLPSYGGGNCWGSRSSFLEDFRDPSINDGYLELVGLTGVAHLGLIQTGMGSAIRIAQGKTIEIRNKKALAAQVDGEPWVLVPNSKIVISLFNQATMLLNLPSKGRKDYSLSL